MNNFGVLIFVIVATVIAIASAQSHNATWGQRGPRDQLIFKEIFVKKSKFMQIVTQDIVFPKKGTSNSKFITQINAFDQYQNGNGGYASLYNGGTGNKNVTIHFKSQRNHGFNFIVEIYGN